VRELVADMQRTAFELQLREGAEQDALDPPVSARLGAIAAPAAIAIGDRDVADFTTVAERLLTGLPRASLHHIPDAGHLLALDQPAAVARLVAEHLGT
jgi:pimeloyl-ACP methyl ester carboxylesterase